MLNSLAPRNQKKSTGLRFCRCLIRSIVLVVFSSGPNDLAVRQEPSVVEANRVVELTFTAENPSADPFNTIDLDVTFTAPLAARTLVPPRREASDVTGSAFPSPHNAVLGRSHRPAMEMTSNAS